MKIKLLLLFLLLSNLSKGQNLFSISGPFGNWIDRVIRYYDGNYIFGGNYLMKMDSAANVKWINYFSTCSVGDVVATNDSGLVIASAKQDSILMIKLDTTPNIVWSKSYFFTHSQTKITSVKSVSGNCFLVLGDYYDYINSIPHLFVLKVDSAGNMLWCKEYRIGNYQNTSFSLLELPDSSIMISARTVNAGSNYKATLLKLNPGGSVIWLKSFSDNPFFLPVFSLFQDTAGIFGLITDGNSTNGMTKIFDLDTSGNSSWCRTLSGNSTGGKNLKRLTDGRFVFSGYRNGAGLFFMDSLGSVRSTNIGINYNVSEITDYIQTKDGFLVMTLDANYGIQKFDSLGNGLCTTVDSILSYPDSISFTLDTDSESYISGSTPTSLYLINSTEIFDSTCELQTYRIEELYKSENVTVYPNPSNDKFNIKSTGEFEKSEIIICNSLGEIIFEGLIENISMVELKPGVYELSVFSPNGHFAHKKIVKL